MRERESRAFRYFFSFLLPFFFSWVGWGGGGGLCADVAAEILFLVVRWFDGRRDESTIFEGCFLIEGVG